MNALSSIHISLAKTCFWMLAARQQLILVSNQINTVTPPTLPVCPHLSACLSPLQFDTELLLHELTKQNQRLCFVCLSDFSGISAHPWKPLPQLILLMVTSSPTGLQSGSVARWPIKSTIAQVPANVPTTHTFLLSTASPSLDEVKLLLFH